MYVCMHACMYVCIYVCMYVLVPVYYRHSEWGVLDTRSTPQHRRLIKASIWARAKIFHTHPVGYHPFLKNPSRRSDLVWTWASNPMSIRWLTFVLNKSWVLRTITILPMGGGGERQFGNFWNKVFAGAVNTEINCIQVKKLKCLQGTGDTHKKLFAAGAANKKMFAYMKIVAPKACTLYPDSFWKEIISRLDKEVGKRARKSSLVQVTLTEQTPASLIKLSLTLVLRFQSTHKT